MTVVRRERLNSIALEHSRRNSVGENVFVVIWGI